MTCIQASTYTCIYLYIHIFGRQQKIIPKEWHPVLPSYKLLETLDFTFLFESNKAISAALSTSVWLFRSFDMLPHWSEVEVSKMFDSTKHHFFLDQNLGSSSCFHSVFIETSFLLRSQFQFRLFPPVSSREKDGLTLEAELQELEEPDLQNTARRLKAQVAHTPQGWL